MRTKVFEIRDRMTFIPVIATALISDDPAEDYLLGRAGYHALDDLSVMVTRLTDGTSTADPLVWGSSRTMRIAHEHIAENFYMLYNGQVIDVEYLLHEKDAPKSPERLEARQR